MKYLILLALLFSPCLAEAHSITKVKLSNVSFSNGPIQTTFNVTSGFFQDNGYNVSQTGYIQTSTQARAIFSTIAPTMTVSMNNNGIFTNYGSNGYCSIAVQVNGSDVGQINCTLSGAETQSFTLGAVGAKTVELRNGFLENRNESGNFFGTFLTSVTFNGDSAATKTTPAPTKRIVIYGDSIACGAASPIPGQDGWPMLLRDYYAPTGSVMMEVVSSQALHYDLSTAGSPSSMATRLSGYFSGFSTKILYIQHGHNDWGDSGGNLWSAASFGTAYASLLDNIHTDDPSIVIYAQTPIVSSSQTDTNTFGDNLAAYRSQITTVCNARSSYCHTIDGSAILTTGQLADGTHPLESAMPTYLSAVKTALGI